MIKLRFTLTLLLALACALSTSAASGLNTGWLVPAGRVHVDRKALKQPEMKLCALTFDDGPDSVYTPAIAGILHKYQVRATFFVAGTRVDAYPRVVQELAAAGHEIGNHTQHHPHMTQYSKERQRTEIRKLQQTLKGLGITPRWFRPPYGEFNATTIKVADEFGLETVLWSVDPRDWAQPGVSKIQSRVLSQTVPGAVVLLHSTHGQTALALPGIIEGLQQKGYRFVTMSEWASCVSAGVPPTATPSAIPLTGTPPPGLEVQPDAAFEITPPEPEPAPAPTDLLGRVIDEPVATPEPEPAMPASLLPAPASAPLSPVEAAMALTVTANFNGPEGAMAVFKSRKGAALHSSLSSLQDRSGPAGYLQSLGIAVPSPAATITAAEEPLTEPAPTAASPALPDWTPPASLSIGDVLANERAAADVRFRPAPQYYLHIGGPLMRADQWEGLSSFYETAQLDGVLLSGGLRSADLPENAPRARAMVSPEQPLAGAALADLSLEDLRRVLAVLAQGNSNVYLTVRAHNVAQFQTMPLISRPWPQQQFILFRHLTRGLEYDAAPENDYAPQWPLAPGVHMARFIGPGREVLALYTLEPGTTTIGLPAIARDWLVPSMGADGTIAGEAPPATFDLGRGVLLLYRDTP